MPRKPGRSIPLTQPAQRQRGSQEPYNQLPEYGNRDLQAYLSDTLAGKYLEEENPYMQQVVDRTTRDAQTAFDQQRANLSRQGLAPGRLGSSFHRQAMGQQNEAFGQGLSDAIGSLRFQGYEAERGRQDVAAGLSHQRDASIWADQTQRYGIDAQAEAQKAAAAAQAAAAAKAAGAQARAAELQAKAQEAATRSNFLLGMAQLGEQSRQFDVNTPLQYGSLANDILGTLGQQDLAGASLTGNLALGQMGQQLGAAQLGQGIVNQQLAGANMIPDIANADLPAAQLAGGFMSDIYGTDAGLSAARMNANAARYGAGLSDQLARDQLQYGSVRDQFAAGDPNAALNNYLQQLGLGAGMAGGTSYTHGVSAGQVIPGGGSPWLAGLQGGLGGAMTGFSLWNQFGNNRGGAM